MRQWFPAAKKSRRRQARRLDRTELQDALEVCARVPVESVLAANRIEEAIRAGSSVDQLWGFPAEGPLEAVCWFGANIVPVLSKEVDGEAALEAFAGVALDVGRSASSIVGDADAVLGLWARIEGRWTIPREIRSEQPSMLIDHPPLIEPDPGVRLSRPDELGTLLPACVAMFTEEVGYSPLVGSGHFYRGRVAGLIERGRSFVRMDNQQVIFKAEIGASGSGVAQVQGVWVPPELRGRGLAAPGMAAVVMGSLSEETSAVSLYVNGFNASALATYRRVGFRPVGTFATILF